MAACEAYSGDITNSCDIETRNTTKASASEGSFTRALALHHFTRAMATHHFTAALPPQHPCGRPA
jgi:hypothetical protein